MLESSRRSFLRTAAMAAPALAIPAATAGSLAQLAPDPLHVTISEFRRQAAEWFALPEARRNIIDYPAFGSGFETMPEPTTKEGTIEALKLAIQEMDDAMYDEPARDLVAAVLKYIETATLS